MNVNEDLGFRWEWEDMPGVRAPEHRATWARPEIRVAGERVTLAEDTTTGSVSRFLYCPLYPLAEWVAFNWWFLRADVRHAGRDHDSDSIAGGVRP